MLPNNSASTLPIPGAFQPPDDQRSALLIDQEFGGVALNDASGGLKAQVWTLTYDSVNVRLKPANGPATTIFSTSEVSELALAFDQNMRPAVAYRKLGEIFLRWWDSTVGGYDTILLGPGFSPRLTLDDKRDSQIGNSDIIVAYIRANALHYRQQRDRFLVERTLRSGLDPATRLKTIGMNRNWRLQFELT